MAAGETNVVRFAVSDNATTDEGPRLRSAYVTVSTTTDNIPAAFMGGDLFRATLPALPGPGVVTYTACATDARGNNACASPLTYTVGDGGPTTGSGGSTGVSMTGNGGATGSTGANGQGGDDFVVDEGGCGCEMPGASRKGAHLGLGVGLAAAVFLLGKRRRKRPARAPSPR